MPPLRPGWYTDLAPLSTDTEARDTVGPFDSEADILDWCKEFGIEFRPEAKPLPRTVFYALPGEMTDMEAYRPWCCNIREVRA